MSSGQAVFWHPVSTQRPSRVQDFPENHIKKVAKGSDFEVTALPQKTQAGESKNGKFVYRSDGKAAGRAGKGGPELSFDTLNGDIRLHAK